MSEFEENWLIIVMQEIPCLKEHFCKLILHFSLNNIEFISYLSRARRDFINFRSYSMYIHVYTLNFGFSRQRQKLLCGRLPYLTQYTLLSQYVLELNFYENQQTLFELSSIIGISLFLNMVKACKHSYGSASRACLMLFSIITKMTFVKTGVLLSLAHLIKPL